MEYIYSQIEQYLEMFPPWLRHLIAESGADAALDSNFLPCPAPTLLHTCLRMFMRPCDGWGQ
jgi:hypothetical protein